MKLPVLVVLALALLSGCGAPPSAAPQPASDAADPRVGTAVSIAFTEGPTVYKDGSVFFSDTTSRRILRLMPDGELSVYRAESNRSNGLIFDEQWRLVACEGDPARITRSNIETGEIEVLADNYQGKRLHQPNDVSFDSQGRLYFSDRPGAQIAADQTGVNAVYRIDPDGSIDRILSEPDIQKPNGLVISPDDKTFYLIEAHPDADHARMIRAYDLAADGTVSNMRVFHDFYPGRSGDGMTIDSAGNLWVAAGLHRERGTSETLDTRPGVHVFSPSGELIDYYRTDEDTVTNCAFGGDDLKTLYVTAGKSLYRIAAPVAGTRR